MNDCWEVMGSSGVSLVTRDTASEGTLGPPSVLLSLFSSCYEASTLLCHTASSSSPNMGATNRRLRGQLSLKKKTTGGKGRLKCVPDFNPRREEEDMVISCPPSPSEWRTYQFGGNRAAASRPASRQVLWLMAAAEEP